MHSEAVTVGLEGLVDLLFALLDLVESVLELLEGQAVVGLNKLFDFLGFSEESSDLFFGGLGQLEVVTIVHELGSFFHGQVENILILGQLAPVKIVCN